MRTRIGRTSAGFVAELRALLQRGEVPAGEFLPCERELAETYKLGRNTVRHALKALEAEGAIAIIPRHGYRVLARTNRPESGCPLAFVLEEAESSESWDPFHKALLAAFQKACSRRRSPLLSLSAKGQPARRIMEQLLNGKAWAAVLDASNPELLALAGRNGLPMTVVDGWSPDVPIDAVVQDDYHGGLLAAGHLLARGHRRITWFGTATDSSHDMARYAGAVAALSRAGLKMAAAFRVGDSSSEAPAIARKMLARAGRRPAILALWSEQARMVARVAREMGKVLGRDLELVGWSAEELFEDTFRPGFPEGRVPPAVVWNMSTMAEAALNRLAERRANPGLPPLKLCVPVKLRLSEVKD